MKGPPFGAARAGLAGSGRAEPSHIGGQRGGTSWVTLLLLAAVAAGAYFGWMWIPVYFDHYTVQQVVRDYMNQAVKNRDDEGLRRNMVMKIRSLAQIDTVDEWGRPVKLPAVPLEENAVTWDRDGNAQPPTLRVAFDYERVVAYPFAKRRTTRVFSVDITNELSLPDWGPAR